MVTVHPGEVVKDYLDTLGMSQGELARQCEMTPKTVSKLVNGQAAIQPYMAVKFETVLKRPAHFWMNLQVQYDLEQAKGK
jgi:addiction module HigA family antidote